MRGLRVRIEIDDLTIDHNLDTYDSSMEIGAKIRLLREKVAVPLAVIIQMLKTQANRNAKTNSH